MELLYPSAPAHHLNLSCTLQVLHVYLPFLPIMTNLVHFVNAKKVKIAVAQYLGIWTTDWKIINLGCQTVTFGSFLKPFLISSIF